MGSTPIPPSLDQLAGRTFAFYPAMLGVEHNEWRFEKVTWSEILVTNTQTGSEIWIPRRFVGEVSRTDDPILIVGLNLELELKSGMVVAHQRRVISMPRAALVLGLLALNASRIREVRQRVTFTGSDRSFDNLSSHDDYLGVTQKLGQPTTDHPQET